MATGTLEDLKQDKLVMSVARALAAANEAALAHGAQPADSVVTITEELSSNGRCWRIHYGPRDFVNRRGGDLTIFIDDETGAVQRILRGQ
jgi:hypothetical protein